MLAPATSLVSFSRWVGSLNSSHLLCPLASREKSLMICMNGKSSHLLLVKYKNPLSKVLLQGLPVLGNVSLAFY